MEIDTPETTDSQSTLLVGGPGQDVPVHTESDQLADQPQSRTVTINGQTFDLPTDVADAVEGREDLFNHKISALGAEVGDLRRAVGSTGTTGTKEITPEVLDFSDLKEAAFDDPVKAFTEVSRRTVEHVEKKFQPYVQQFEKTQQQNGFNRFWSEFEKEHPELKPARVVAQGILDTRFPDWGHLTLPKARQELAKATKRAIAEITNGQPKNKSVVLEGGGGVSKQVPAGKPTQSRTLSQVIGDRAAKKKAGAKA